MAGHPTCDSPVEHGPGGLAPSDSLDRGQTSSDLRTMPDQARWTYELIGGKLLVSPNVPNLRRATCALMVSRLLWQDKSDLKMLLKPFEYVPAPGYCLRPDIMMVEPSFEEDQVREPPVLVVEVLAAETRPADQRLRQAAYAKYGVEDYWIVDPAGPSIRALRRPRQLVGFAVRADDFTLVAEAGPGELLNVFEPLAMRIDPVILLDG
jgi:Uma2 family endonuclease